MDPSSCLETKLLTRVLEWRLNSVTVVRKGALGNELADPLSVYSEDFPVWKGKPRYKEIFPLRI